MGYGLINPNKAMDPGLIYNANLEDYINLLYALNLTTKQIQAIIRSSSSYNCCHLLLDPNYPSFIVFFAANYFASNPKTVKEFSIMVTNFGEGTWTYNAKVTCME